MRIVLSAEPETIRLPSSENATDITELVWPSKGPDTVWPVAAFQMRIVLSPEPDATSSPSGENATYLTQLVWPSKGP